MKNGFCNHPQKKSEIVTEWKCVDIQYPNNITPDERKKRDAICRKKDWYGVCELCRFFKPETDHQPAGTTAKPADKPVYISEKKKETVSGSPEKDQQGESWLEDLV